jgi:hypothetical protein
MKVARYEVPGSHEKQVPSRRYGMIGCPDGGVPLFVSARTSDPRRALK